MPKKPNNFNLYLKPVHMQKLGALQVLMAERSPSSTLRRMIEEWYWNLIGKHQQKTTKGEGQGE